MSGDWPDDDVAPAIATAGRAMMAAMLRRLADKGFEEITPAIIAFITQIDPEGDRAAALAHRAGVTKQAMSQLLRTVVSRGYVEQVADPGDTRAKIIRCTKRGVSLRDACFTVRDELHQLVVDELGERNADRLRDDLERVQAAFRSAAPSAPASTKRATSREQK